jgi:hypothetical protein
MSGGTAWSWARRAAHVALCSLLLLGGACDGGAVKPSGTLGEFRRVEFSYARSCFFGCPIEQPLLAGTRERIALSGAGDDAGLRADSSDDRVARFALARDCFCERRGGGGGRVAIAEDASCAGMGHSEKHCENTVLVEAGVSGLAALELRDARDARDALFDRVNVRVAEAERARARVTLPGQLGAAEHDEIALRAGESAEVELTLYDDAGRALLAPQGVRWRIEDGGVAEVAAWLIGRGAELDAGLDVTVEALSAGETALIAGVPGLEHRLPVTVAP